MRALILVALALGGCLRATTFHCTEDTDCNLSGVEGVCEPEGFCSIVDRNCASGRAYNEFSGSLSRQCVGAPDAGVDPGLCAPSFVPVLGAPGNHLYYLFDTPADFITQEAACAVQGSTTYLAIPDSAPELAALLDLSGQTTMWVGLTDRVTEGTFLTLRGDVPAFLPWATGQPDDAAPGEDCVAGITADATIQDDQCDLMLRAFCECEP